MGEVPRTSKKTLCDLTQRLALMCFSYACDDFIVNDTNDTKLDRMRAVITKHQEQQSPGIGNGSEATNPPITKPVAPSEEASVSSREKRAQRRRTVSSSNLSSTRENDQVWPITQICSVDFQKNHRFAWRAN